VLGPMKAHMAHLRWGQRKKEKTRKNRSLAIP
jgi:hypothetical protein